MKTSQKGLPLILLFIFQTAFGATDTLTTDEIIRDGETLMSSDGVFELGFFKPGNSVNRYVGMWYKNVPDRKIVWVANRNSPLTSAGGLLKVVQPGLLMLLNDTNDTVWSSNKSGSGQKPIAQLLDSGNLVVRDANDDRPENFLWQSFDYPTNVALPGMKFGWNLVTGTEIYFPAWKSDDDPSPGALSLHLDPTGYPQILMKEGSKIRSRMGPWNGIIFSGGPIDFQIPMYRLRLVMNQKEVRYFQETIDKSFVTIVAISPGGVAERWTWVDRTQRWITYISFPADNCDTYRLCGAYGSCSLANSPLCTCMDRFVPKDPVGWAKADWNNGCVRRTNLSCQGDIFLKYSGIKLPDARYTRNNANMTLEECRAECLKSCSCMAYTLLDILKGNGCMIWYEELIDVKIMVSDGQDIYIRMASTEAESVADPERKKRKTILIAGFASALGIGLIGLSLSLYLRKRSIDPTINRQGKYHSIQEKNSEIPLFDLSYILKSTDNFATDNKLGEGGIFQIKPHARMPRTYKRFSGLMVQLLQKLHITAAGKGEKLLRVIKNPVTQYLPIKSRKIGFSHSSEKLVNIHDYVGTVNRELDLVFVVGAMAHGKIDKDYVEDYISISSFPLSAAYCISMITTSLEQKWEIL